MPTNADVLEMPRIADYLGKERIAQDTTVWLTERRVFFDIPSYNNYYGCGHTCSVKKLFWNSEKQNRSTFIDRNRLKQMETDVQRYIRRHKEESEKELHTEVDSDRARESNRERQRTKQNERETETKDVVPNLISFLVYSSCFCL